MKTKDYNGYSNCATWKTIEMLSGKVNVQLHLHYNNYASVDSIGARVITEGLFPDGVPGLDGYIDRKADVDWYEKSAQLKPYQFNRHGDIDWEEVADFMNGCIKKGKEFYKEFYKSRFGDDV